MAQLLLGVARTRCGGDADVSFFVVESPSLWSTMTCMHNSASFAQDGMHHAYLGCMLGSAIHEDLRMSKPW